MKYSIDEVSIHKEMMFCAGWFSWDETVSYPEVSIANAGVILTPLLTIKERPDVAAVHGGHALRWGFELRCILKDGTQEALRELTIIVGSGLNAARIKPLSSNARKQARRSFDSCVDRFFAEVNSKKIANILEIGSRARSGIIRKGFFNNTDYTGLDIMEGPNVDIVGDAHFLSRIFPKNHFDFIYSISTFEHLLFPWKVAIEMNAVLKMGGMAFIQSHQTWPIHDAPWDYFRFSEYSWHALFNADTGYELLLAANGDRATIVSCTQSEDFSTFLENQPGYLSSACLVRKIANTDIDWNVDPMNVIEKRYPA